MTYSPKRIHSAAFKTAVVLEMLKEEETISQICSRCGIHPTQAKKWKKRVLEGIPALFADKIGAELKKKEEIIEELYRQIGQLKVELDWLKKRHLGIAS